MFAKGFKGLLESLDEDELSELIYLDPFFIYRFCYMLSLEFQLEKEEIVYDRA